MEIYEIIGKLLGAVVVAILAYFAPKVKTWMNVHMNKTMVDNVMVLVDAFVRAADQLYHDDDPTGEKRNAYVKKQLMLAGVEITETVINLIEGAVFDVNMERYGVSPVAFIDETLPTMTSGYIAPTENKVETAEDTPVEKKSAAKKTTAKKSTAKTTKATSEG